MEKGKGEDNARPPECRRAALLAGLVWWEWMECDWWYPRAHRN